MDGLKKDFIKVKMMKEKISLTKKSGAKLPDSLKSEFTAIAGAVISEDSQLELF